MNDECNMKVLRHDDYQCVKISAESLARLRTTVAPTPALTTRLHNAIDAATPIADQMRAYCAGLIEWAPHLLTDADVVTEIVHRGPEIAMFLVPESDLMTKSDDEVRDCAVKMAERLGAWIEILRLIIIAGEQSGTPDRFARRIGLRDSPVRRVRRH